MSKQQEAMRLALEALELGYDSAKAEADQYHAAMAGYRPQRHAEMDADVQKIAAAITALRAALAEPEGGGNLPPPLQEPKDFDHGIDADRFRVVRGAFWWHVLIGDSPTEHGKFRSRASAEKMAADLLREFRNGAFVQYEAALAEPCPCGDRPAAQCPGEWEPGCDLGNNPKYAKRVEMTPKELAASIKRGEKWKVAEPVEKPVAWFHTDFGSLELSRVQRVGWKPLYAAPPQRKPLSEQEIWHTYKNLWMFHPSEEPRLAGDVLKFARAIERAHGIT
jgi:hypothetical protein